MLTVVKFSSGEDLVLENAKQEIAVDQVGTMRLLNHDGDTIAVLFPHNVRAIHYPDMDRKVQLATGIIKGV